MCIRDRPIFLVYPSPCLVQRKLRGIVNADARQGGVPVRAPRVAGEGYRKDAVEAVVDVPRLPPRPGLEPGPARVVEPDAPADAQAGVEQALDLDALVVGLGRADEPGSGGKHHGLAGEVAAGGQDVYKRQDTK